MTDSNPTRRELLATIGTAGAIGLAGCGYQPGAGDLLWEASINAFYTTGSSTLVGDDRLGICCFDGNFTITGGIGPRTVTGIRVAAITPDGSFQWHSGVDGSLSLEPALSDTAVFVTDTDRQLHVFDREDGELTTSIDLDGDPTGLTATSDAALIVTDDGTLHATSPSGSDRWSNSLPSSGDVVATDDLAVVGCDDGTVLAVDLETAEERWRTSIDESQRVRCALENDAEAVLAVEGTTGADDRLLAIDLENGDHRWSVTAPRTTSAPAVGADLIALESDGTITAFDRASGEQQWEYAGVDSPPVVGAEGVYAITEGCEAVCIAPDGSVAWRSPIDDTQCSVSVTRPLLLETGVVCRTGQTRLRAFRRDPGDRYSVR